MANEAKPEVGVDVSRETLSKMNKTELCSYGRVVYGLPLHIDGTHKEEMIDQIMSAGRKFQGNQGMIAVKMDAEVDVPPGYVKIRVSPGEYNPNNRPVVVGLNFKMATIPVNMDVVMPGKWVVCLKDAVERRYFMTRDPASGKEFLETNDQHKHPFSILVDNR